MASEKLTAMNRQYAGMIATAESKAKGFDQNTPMPPDVRTEIEGILGKADELMAQIKIEERLEKGQEYGKQPEASDVDLSWRKAALHEGEVPVDPMAWRELEVKTVFGTKRIRYQVPLAVEKKGYPAAFEAYMRKGMPFMGAQDVKTLQEGLDASGGHLVPEQYLTEMLRKVATTAQIRSLARVLTTGRDVLKWPKLKYATDDKYTSGVRLTWTGELPSSSTVHRVTEPVFGLAGITVHTAMASLPLSNDFLEDSAADIMGLSTELMGEAFGLGEDDVFINGSGVSQPVGLVTRATAGDDLIPFVVSGSAATITADGIIDLFFGLPAQYRRNGRVLMNSGTAKVARKLKDGGATGRYLWDSMQSPNFGGLSSPAAQDTILGVPVIYDEFMPDLGANNFPILFGDFGGYYVVDRVGLSIQRLSEVYAESNITLLLARKRVGGDVMQPWRLRFQKCST